MRLVLTSLEEPLALAWERHCSGLDPVRVHRGSILDVPCDAVVSPANSFGFMDGGVDAVYRRHFGPDVEARVQSKIASQHHGELVVGTAELVETNDQQIPYLIVAPTMRVPMRLPGDSVNAYLAMRAVLLLAQHGRLSSGQPIADRVRTIALPGLGTGVGGMGVNTCAHQVRSAIDEFLLGERTPPRTWAEASARHQLLYADRPQRLQHSAPSGGQPPF